MSQLGHSGTAWRLTQLRPGALLASPDVVEAGSCCHTPPGEEGVSKGTTRGLYTKRTGEARAGCKGYRRSLSCGRTGRLPSSPPLTCLTGAYRHRAATEQSR